MTILFVAFLVALAFTLQWYRSKLVHDRWLAQRPEPKTGLQGHPRAASETYTNELPKRAAARSSAGSQPPRP